MTREKEIKMLADFLKQDCLNKPIDYCMATDCYICRAAAVKAAARDWTGLIAKQ